jgi:hypothetical protein
VEIVMEPKHPVERWTYYALKDRYLPYVHANFELAAENATGGCGSGNPPRRTRRKMTFSAKTFTQLALLIVLALHPGGFAAAAEGASKP